MLLLAGCWAIGGLVCYLAWLGPPPLGDIAFSPVVLDRDGRLLRAFATPQGRWRLPVRVEDVDPRFIEALLSYEDKRFYQHFGVDPVALMRAALTLVWRGEVTSGGSTLTMQVARLLEPRAERSLATKLRQMVRAIELERRLAKSAILELYLSLAPYGGNLQGIRAATLGYFAKEPRRLTLAEIALLVALPQAPELRRPDRSPALALRARNYVLQRLAAGGRLSLPEFAEASASAVPVQRRPMPALSPHAAEQAVAAQPQSTVHQLTIDARLQQSLEALANERARALGPEVSMAVVVVDNTSGDVLAHVGAADYSDERRAGRIDMTAALRSPGSTLKPFIYGIGFEDGLIHPETLIDDRPVHFGSYAPENFDLTFQGTVTVRRALQQSLNVPAISVLEAIGPDRLAARLAGAGAQLTLPKGDVPSLAMGLGGVGIRLSDLTMLYCGIARLGNAVPLRWRPQGQGLPERRLLAPAAAWYLGNVLLGTPPPQNAIGGRIAFKTGTSYGYRDAWAIGFDSKRTIGVWVGRPDGAPVPGLVGRLVAAPILFDAFARTERPAPALLPAPPGAVLSATNALSLPLRHFGRAGPITPGRDNPPSIVFPPDGANVERSAGKSEPMLLSVMGGVLPVSVLLNGAPIGSMHSRRTLFWQPDGPGFVRLTVVDARGQADSVLLRVQ